MEPRPASGASAKSQPRLGQLEATTRWLAANEEAFLSLAAAANAGS